MSSTAPWIGLGLIMIGYLIFCFAKQPENKTRGLIILFGGLVLLAICAAHLETLAAIKALTVKP